MDYITLLSNTWLLKIFWRITNENTCAPPFDVSFLIKWSPQLAPSTPPPPSKTKPWQECDAQMTMSRRSKTKREKTRRAVHLLSLTTIPFLISSFLPISQNTCMWAYQYVENTPTSTQSYEVCSSWHICLCKFLEL